MSLVDGVGRTHTNLRVSVTDRCNIRCYYCMPEEAVQFGRREEILSFEEIERVVRIAAGLGVDKVRALAEAFGMDGKRFETPLPVTGSTVGNIDSKAALAQSSQAPGNSLQILHGLQAESV